MRKLMIMAAAVMAVAVASAAKLDWSVSAQAVQPVDGTWTAAPYSGLPQYDNIWYGLVLSADRSDALAAISGDFDPTLGLAPSADYLDYAKRNGGRGALGKSTIDDARISTGPQDVSLLVFFQSAIDDQWYYTWSELGARKGYTGDPSEGDSATFNAAAFNAGLSPEGWQPVPEPTSVALLALGVAALGLRRRRA